LTEEATSDSGKTAEPENPVPVAVTVILADPNVAVLDAASVRELEPVPGAVILVGANTAVTPAGNPLTARLSAEFNPPWAVVVSLIWSVFPRASEPDGGVSVIARPGRETASDAVLVTLPAVPETARFQEPGARVLAGARVSALVPAPGEAIDLGLKLAVRPEGNPLTDREVAELRPPLTEVVSFIVAPLLVSATEELERVSFSA
jgi:hypothetical protein